MYQLTPFYQSPTNETQAAVRDALAAWHRGPVSLPVESALKNLDTLSLQGASAPDLGIAERYVAECWAEYQAPKGAIYKVLA